MWKLVLMIVINGMRVRAHEEFPVFDTLTECHTVLDAWMDVPVSGGHVAIAACEKVKYGEQTDQI